QWILLSTRIGLRANGAEVLNVLFDYGLPLSGNRSASDLMLRSSISPLGTLCYRPSRVGSSMDRPTGAETIGLHLLRSPNQECWWPCWCVGSRALSGSRRYG